MPDNTQTPAPVTAGRLDYDVMTPAQIALAMSLDLDRLFETMEERGNLPSQETLLLIDRCTIVEAERDAACAELEQREHESGCTCAQMDQFYVDAQSDNEAARSERDAANARLADIDAATQGDAVETVMRKIVPCAGGVKQYNDIRDAVAALVARAERAEEGWEQCTERCEHYSNQRDLHLERAERAEAERDAAEEALIDIADEITEEQGGVWVQWSRHREVIAAARERVAARKEGEA